jgi:hypothetical protein
MKARVYRRKHRDVLTCRESREKAKAALSWAKKLAIEP